MFDILDTNCNPPPGWSKASNHIIFDVSMILERNFRWLNDVHITPEPENSTYTGVVSQESVRITLTYYAMNDLDVCECDIQKAYLQIPSSGKHVIICGPEFCLDNLGKKKLIICALYGGKHDGADY